MKKIRGLLAGLAFMGLLTSSTAWAQRGLFSQSSARNMFGSESPEQYQPVSYEQEAQSSCDGYGTCDSPNNSCYDPGCEDVCYAGILDNTEFLLGGDSYASLGDFPSGGYNNSFGMVAGFNSAFGLGDSPIRAQVGASYGAYDFSGRGSGIQPQSLEQQIYITAGVSKRSDVLAGDRISWGIVYDTFITNNWGFDALELNVGQARGLVGFALNECNEIGVWGTLAGHKDPDTITGRGPANLRAMNQGNLFWRHNYQYGGSTMLYGGVMDNADVGDWVIGLSGRSPLSDTISLYGNFNYVVPGVGAGILGDQTDQWNVSFGLVFNFGCKSISPSVSGAQGLPLMPVANNGSFLITD